ncbi:MAG: excinuclease ABC subunit UvrA [Planctomycetota bacterium]
MIQSGATRLGSSQLAPPPTSPVEVKNPGQPRTDAIDPGEPRLTKKRAIRVRGAREHNLKGVDLDVPHDALVVVTGLSGSGKSSLAFDTIFAEGQRKYMESLSAYARQFLDQLKKPDVDDIEGLPPTIAIEQRSSGHNPRSTVSTSTEIYDYLRLLFARIGTPTCWEPTKINKKGEVTARCGERITASNPSQIAATIAAMDEGTRLMVLAPVVVAKKGYHADVLQGLVGRGFVRARVNGEVIDLREALKAGGENPLKLGRYEKHTIEAVVDRIVVKADARQRLVESVETALKLGEGVVIISAESEGKGSSKSDAKTWTDQTFSEHYACPIHPHCALAELEPRIFSFNSPFGACPRCDGLGSIHEFDEDLVVPDYERSLRHGGIAPWKKNGPGGMYYPKLLRRFCRMHNWDYDAPLEGMPDDLYELLLYGDERDHDTPANAWRDGRWAGVINILHEWFEKTDSQWAKDHLHQFMAAHECPQCFGARLRIESLSVLVRTRATLPKRVVDARKRHGLVSDPHAVTIADLTTLTITEALEVLEALELTPEQEQIAGPIVREVKARLGFLASVGLEYLSLDRKTATLSGGEAQRIRLATQVGSGLVGACYVLDEPTIGLHQRDNGRLIRTLRHLADIGNTVIVVEHDEEMIRAADYLVDVGPGPGVHGGTVVAAGTVDEICDCADSVTGLYLSGARSIEVPNERRDVAETRAIVVKGAAENNLKKVDAAFPLGGIVCVTGVSGSGKSTLVNDILLAVAKREITGSRTKPGKHTRVNGLGKLDRVIEVDQSPIGRTPRSNPATYTNMFDEIRQVFTKTKEAQIRGYKPGRFSFNVKGGRCESCQGQGTKKIEMHFLPDVYVECEVCQGSRYNRETLDVRYRGKNIAEVLAMTVEEACDFFANHGKISRFAECLRDVGLGYLTLGQPSTQLSGGEAQRVKLATELGKGVSSRGEGLGAHTLYVLDEPTTGLHFEDVRKLVGVLHRLADAGNTLVVIEHNLDVIKCADWIVDLGPEGGAGGGQVIASGTPEQVAANTSSHTGRYLGPLLAG